MTPGPDKKSGWDVAGFGKVAQAIPSEVYKRSAVTVLKTFESLVAPITQTTEGLGQLIRQTFDNWVEVRKAIGTYTLEQAVIRAKAKTEKLGKVLQPPSHPKTFLRALEEGSLETDSVVHEMWVNLLASQLTDSDSHPRFVSILSSLGPEEARLLKSLKPRPSDPHVTSFFGGHTASSGMYVNWVSEIHDQGKPWNLSCTILCQHDLASISPLQTSLEGTPGGTKGKLPVLLHLSPFGIEFMAIVDSSNPQNKSE